MGHSRQLRPEIKASAVTAGTTGRGGGAHGDITSTGWKTSTTGTLTAVHVGPARSATITAGQVAAVFEPWTLVPPQKPGGLRRGAQ